MTDDAAYLLVLYAAEQADGPPVSPGDVADRLDRSPAAVTEMLQRMADRGLLTYEPYEGATLTAEGRAAAADYHETYEVLVRFFRNVLALDDPEAEARQFVGVVSNSVAERLATTLLGAESPAALSESSPAPRSETS